MENWMQQLKETYIKMLAETGSNNPPPAQPLSSYQDENGYETPLSPSERVFERPGSGQSSKSPFDGEGFRIGNTKTLKDNDGKTRYFVRDWNRDGSERPLQPITKDEYERIQIKAANDPASGGQSGRFGVSQEPVPVESSWSRHHNETQFDKQKREQYKNRKDEEAREQVRKYYGVDSLYNSDAAKAGYYRDEDGTVIRHMP